MASTSPRSWASTAILIVTTALTACTDTLVTIWHRATTWMTDLTVSCARAMPRLVHEWPSVAYLRVQKARAEAFIERMLRREVRLTPGWRMVPSI